MRQVRRYLAAVAAGAVVVAGVGLGTAHADQGAGHWQPAPWSTATPVAAVNAPGVADGCPIESPDGRSLYFASVRSGGDNDIWVATRTGESGEFGAPVMLPEPVNSDAQDFCPTPLPGGFLLFVSTRGGTDAYGTPACGAGDIYVTHRRPITGAWTPPRNLGCAPDGPNGVGMEYGPSLVRGDDGVRLYFSSGDPIGAGTQDIYVSELGRYGRFGAPTAVAELNSAFDDVMPNVSRDGREVVFASSRPGGAGGTDIYTSTRGRSDASAWTSPTNLGSAVNTAGSESRPSLSTDGLRLYFGRNGDIQVSTREWSRDLD
jgi:Tol biopolymer transport system component